VVSSTLEFLRVLSPLENRGMNVNTSKRDVSMFKGFVLRKPRVSASNSPFTSPPDTVVLNRDSDGKGFSDRDAYLASFVQDEDAKGVEYLVVPSHTGNLVTPSQTEPLKVFFTRNDEVTRFAFDDTTNRWSTLPGGSPEVIGAISLANNLRLTTVEDTQGSPRVVVGDLDQAPVPVTWIYDQTNWPPPVIPSGTAAAFVPTGEIRFASDILENAQTLPVYVYRKNFFPRDSSTGLLGNADQTLYLNPVPSATERPLIRSRFGSYLKVSPLSDPQGDDQLRWDTDSGKLTLLTPLGSDPLYYDGVYNNRFAVSSFGHVDLGVINPSFTSTVGIAPVDGHVYDVDHLILYVKETGIAIEEIEVVSDFSQPFTLPRNKAQAKIDAVTKEVTFNLSYAFMTLNAGNTLRVGTGDFYLENGVTFRMFRSPLDLSNEKNVPDAQNLVTLENEILSDSVRTGAFTSLPQVPLQDLPGYGPNVFFQLERGVRKRILEPDVDVFYDFAFRQLRWTDRVVNESYDILSPVPAVKLRHEVLLKGTEQFLLDTGSGPVPLQNGEDFLIDTDLGQISFATSNGKVVYSGVGKFSEGSSTFEALNLTFDFQSDLGSLVEDLPEGTHPLLVLGNGSVYKVVGSTSNTLEVHRPFDASSLSETFEVLTPSEVVYANSLRGTTLNKRWVFPEVIYRVDPTQPTDLVVPDSESFSFEVEGSPYAYEMLEPVSLGTLQQNDLPAVLEIPAYFQASEARYTLLRGSQVLTEVPGVPGRDEYALDGQGVLTFNVDDVQDFGNMEVVLDPLLSVGRASGPVEVLRSSRAIGLPDSLLAVNLQVKCLLREDQYQVQREAQTIYLFRPLRSNARLEVRHFKDAQTPVTDAIGFPVRETVSLQQGQTTILFGQGKKVDTSRPVTVLVNGSPVSSQVNFASNTVTFSPIRANRLVQVSYFVRDALGGERLATLLHSPYVPDVNVEKGTQQGFNGNHVDVLSEGSVLQFNDHAFVVTAVTYDAGSDLTQVSLLPPVPEKIVNPVISVTSKPVDKGQLLNLLLDRNSQGERELRIFGDVTDQLFARHVLYLDNAPYRIVALAYDESRKVTAVALESRLLREYTDPSIRLSVDPVYEEDPTTLVTRTLPFVTEPYALIKFDADGKGTRLKEGVDFRLLESGQVVIDPAVTEPPKSHETWYLAYLGRRILSPILVAGRRIHPRLFATYTRFINATEENGIAGSRLRASFSFYAPDSFYFRALPLQEYALEVAESIDRNAKALSSSSGPTTSYGLSLKNHQRGNTSLIWEEGDLRDKDRVGRRFIAFYNSTAQGLESYLQVLDGRVIGDRKGQFKFTLGPYDSPGGEDPVEGTLYPYYATKAGTGQKPSPAEIDDVDLDAQEGFVRNSIDDLILVSKKPFEVSLFGPSTTFQYLGTFQEAWKPGRLSRFYPQRSRVATLTPPDKGNTGTYAFLRDFLSILGDLKQENIMSLTGLSSRPAQAWVKEDGAYLAGGGVALKVGMSFLLGDSEATNGPEGSPNIAQGDPSRNLPGFKAGDIVSLGYVSYQRNLDGEVEKEVVLYARDREILSVGASNDEIILTRVSDPADFEDGATDPFVLFGQVASPGYLDTSGRLPEKNDTLFVQSTNFYRQYLDYVVDASEGELLNVKLPNIAANLIGQEAPEPGTYLEAEVIFKNARTEPKRFPALDGQPLDDDGLVGIPYHYPLKASETISLDKEADSLMKVLDDTTRGLVSEITVQDGHTLEFPLDLSLLAHPPQTYDLVLIEGDVAGATPWSQGSTPYYVSQIDGNLLYLKAFLNREMGLLYMVNNALSGTGSRIAASTWQDDALRNFSGLNGLMGTLQVGTSSYGIASLGAGGQIVTTTPITEVSGSYTVNLSGTGFIDGDLHLFKDAYDFTEVESGSSLTIAFGFNSGTYSIFQGVPNALKVRVLSQDSGTLMVSVSPIPSGLPVRSGAVLFGQNRLYVESWHPDFNEGDAIIVPSTEVNGGYYRITGRFPQGLPYPYLEVDPVFRSNQGNVTHPDPLLHTFEMAWVLANPRRFSTDLMSLMQTFLQRRVIYQDTEEAPADIKTLIEAEGYTFDSPSLPSLSILEGLVDTMFGTPVVQEVDGSTIDVGTYFVLESLSSDFVQSGTTEGAYVLIREGDQRGFYRVHSVLSATQLRLKGGVTFPGNYSSLEEDTNLTFEVFQPVLFSDRTYELVLYEYMNVLKILDRLDAGIRSCLHAPLAFEGDPPFLRTPGDPGDPALSLHLSGVYDMDPVGVEDRKSWITLTPSLRDEIDAILKGTEDLYDLRFVWIDFRINLEDGTLPRIDRFVRERAKRERKLLKELKKLRA
jgi:hypothetical protein